MKKISLFALTYWLLSLCSLPTQATIVQFQTVFGTFEVNLYDERTPKTVANFLTYVNDGRYNNSVIHRSVPNFVLQGGGYTTQGTSTSILDPITSDNPIESEPVISNRRGTIAMALFGKNPNSATNQWFFNLSDNSANLDVQNGGFTVFGEVIGDGMQVIDAMAAVPTFSFQPPFGNLPLSGFSDEEFAANTPFEENNIVLITNIVIIDAALDTASTLMPILNTSAPQQPEDGNNNANGGGTVNQGSGSSNPNVTTPINGGSGGGSVPLAYLLFIMLIFGITHNTFRHKS